MPPTPARVLPYGEWPSPLTAESLTQSSAVRPVPVTDGDDVYVLRTRPETGSVVHLVRLPRAGESGAGTELSPRGFSVGSRVHEYGGGEYAVRDGIVLAVERTSQRLWRLDGEPRPLVPEAEGARVRFAAMAIDPARGLAYAIREDHRGVPDERPEPVNALVRLRLDREDPAFGTPLTLPAWERPVTSGEAPAAPQPDDNPCRGTEVMPDRVGGSGGQAAAPDFVIDPCLSPDGRRLAWVQWAHPHMPWDAAEVWVGDLDPAGDLTAARRLAGGPGHAAYEPVWLDADRLAVLDERTGWMNPYLIDVATGATTPLHEIAQEYGAPPWVPRTRTMTALGDGRLVAVRWVDAFAQLTLLDPAAGTARDLGGPRGLADGLCVGRGGVVLRSAYPDRPAAVVVIDPDSGAETELWRYGPQVPPGFAPVPEPISWPGEGGATAYGFLYRPTHPEVRAPEGEAPPLMVLSHGGPTAATAGVLSAATAYWTSRGFAVLDVNYGGSTGYGRAYRHRLAGTWGIVDVGDCVAGARHLARTGVVDARRLAIRGGSAGGYVVLAALAFHDVFTAGLSSYGVSDLAALARDTHKFESRYPIGLIGPWPEAATTYAARSPIHHVDRLATPLLLLQGAEDKVVPPDQARLMADAVRAKGVPVALLEFPGEGHGFREPANQVRALEAETSFLAQVWGHTPAEPIDPIAIDNLPQPAR